MVRSPRSWKRLRADVAGLFRLADFRRSIESAKRSTKLGAETLEAREVPAQFTVSLLDPGTGRPGSAGATFSGTGLFLNNANVTADSAADAVRLALAGSVDVSYLGEAANYAFSNSTSGTDSATQDFSYLISQRDAANDPAVWTVGLEDLSASNMRSLGVDWDYDDRFWDVAVTEIATPVIGDGTGLLARYFNDSDTPNLDLIRVDPQVNNDWGSSSPDAAVTTDHFKATWNGEILAAYTQTYKFTTVSDDGVRLWVNGQLLVDNWTDHGETRNSGSISLVAGQLYDIRMEYYENSGQATAKLLWSGRYQAEEAVPQSYLYPDAPPNPVAGTGTGLLARYFNDSNSPNLDLMRVDAQVNNDWGAGSPDAAIDVDHFRATWTGQVQAPFDGPFTFSTLSDDGVRLWVNGNLVIDNWTDHGPIQNNSASITLVAGQTYDLQMEYYENTGGAVAKLFWASPDIVREVIPTQYLYPANPPTPVVGTGTGLDATYFSDPNLAMPVLNRVDAQVANNWGIGSPDAAVPNDNFSARWSGFIQTPFSGPFTFSTVSDDGVRLWINGQLVIDNWTDHGTTRNKSGTINLVAGAFYSVVMEYYERGGDAVAHLEWASPALIREPIPQQYLYPASLVTIVSVSGSGSVTENGSSGSLTFTRTGDLSQSLTVNLAVVGSATSGEDYVALPGTVTFAANSATATLVITQNPDNEFEDADYENDIVDPETIIVSVVSGTGYAADVASATISLVDDPPVISTSVTWSLDSQSSLFATVTLTRSGGNLAEPLTAWFEPQATLDLGGGEEMHLVFAATAEFGANEATTSVHLFHDNNDREWDIRGRIGGAPITLGIRPDLSDYLLSPILNQVGIERFLERLNATPNPITFQEYLVLKDILTGVHDVDLSMQDRVIAKAAAANKLGKSLTDWRTIPTDLIGGSRIITGGTIGGAFLIAPATWPKLEPRLNAAITDLASVVYATRDAADKTISKALDDALTRSDMTSAILILNKLEGAASESEDAEVKRRLEFVVQRYKDYAIFNKYYYSKKQAAAAAAGVAVFGTPP